MTQNEQEIEQEIQAKGLNAPRLTPQHIDSICKEVHFWQVPNTATTVCAITLQNSFTVIGKSAPASEENFDEEIGRRIAFEDARRQIWQLEGYLLRQRLHEQRQQSQQQQQQPQ